MVQPVAPGLRLGAAHRLLAILAVRWFERAVLSDGEDTGARTDADGAALFSALECARGKGGIRLVNFDSPVLIGAILVLGAIFVLGVLSKRKQSAPAFIRKRLLTETEARVLGFLETALRKIAL